MSTTKRHLAFAAALAALSLPAFAGDEAPAAKQDCSVCNDPTFPELRVPAPAFVLSNDGGTASASLRNDPTQPEIREPAPVIVLGGDDAGEPSALRSDPTWPATSSLAPALVVKPHAAEDRVVQR
jgi:hypothetical protein